MDDFYNQSIVERWGIIGAVIGAIVGGIAGLVIGLKAYAATAVFAVFEVGVPTVIVGGLIGVFCGCIAMLGHRVAAHR